MTAPLVPILYNQPTLPLDHPDAESERSIVDIAVGIGEILGAAGFRTMPLPLKRDPMVLWEALKKRKPAVVFNLFEGNLEDAATESYVASLLQWKGVPFTGSPMHTLELARAKHLTKQILRGAGLPTADFFVVSELPVIHCPLEWPVIVKAALQDASVGLAQDSVCTNQEQLEARVEYMLQTYGPPVMVEEFISGREFNVALIELPDLQCLPVAEIIFEGDKERYWPILTYTGKWRPGTEEYDQSPPKCPAEITARLSGRLCTIASEAYRLLGCRDYARIDFRVRPNGKPLILEVNPNPDISENAGFVRCLGAADITYAEFIVRLVEHALARKTPTPTFAMDQCESLQPSAN